MATTCMSLLKGLAISRSRATISRSRRSASMSSSPVGSSIPRTRSRSRRSTTKSAPCSLNASTGPGALFDSARSASCRRSLFVRTGFCSEPDSANSRLMTRWFRTTHVWSCPVLTMWASVPSPLLAGRERHVGLGPLAGPQVLVALERRGAHPVLECQVVGVADAEAQLLRRVHQEQPAERPERLPAERRLRLLIDDEDAASRVREL